MKQFSELDINLESEIIRIIEEGNNLEEKADYSNALKKYNEAYNNIPEPKLKWEMISAWLMGSYFNVYFKLGNYKNAKKWAELELENRSSDIDVAPYMDLGMVLFELNELDEAYSNFKKIYQYGKERPFKEYPRKYFSFFIDKYRK